MSDNLEAKKTLIPGWRKLCRYGATCQSTHIQREKGNECRGAYFSPFVPLIFFSAASPFDSLLPRRAILRSNFNQITIYCLIVNRVGRQLTYIGGPSLGFHLLYPLLSPLGSKITITEFRFRPSDNPNFPPASIFGFSWRHFIYIYCLITCYRLDRFLARVYLNKKRVLRRLVGRSVCSCKSFTGDTLSCWVVGATNYALRFLCNLPEFKFFSRASRTTNNDRGKRTK